MTSESVLNDDFPTSVSDFREAWYATQLAYYWGQFENFMPLPHMKLSAHVAVPVSLPQAKSQPPAIVSALTLTLTLTWRLQRLGCAYVAADKSMLVGHNR